MNIFLFRVDTQNQVRCFSGMSRKFGPNCGYPQFRVIFAQKLGWCWVVGVNLPKLGLNYPNFTPISPPNCGKIGVKLVLWLWLGVVLHILIGLGLGVSKPHFAHPWYWCFCIIFLMWYSITFWTYALLKSVLMIRSKGVDRCFWSVSIKKLPYEWGSTWY